MKKVFLSLAAMAATLLCMTACQKEESAQRTLLFSATTESYASQSKTAIGDDGLHIWWENSDEVALRNITGTESDVIICYAYPHDDDPCMADFFYGGGPLPDIPSSVAVYPATFFADNVPAVQHSSIGGLTGFPMIGFIGTQPDGTRICQFTNICGVVKLHLTEPGINVSGISITTDRAINGTGVSYNQEDRVLLPGQATTGPEATTTLSIATPQNISDGKDFYMYLPVADYTSTFVIKIYADNGTVATLMANTSETSPIRIERSKITTITLSANKLKFKEPGILPGYFTINSDGGQVRFSQGNLQYTAAGSHLVATGDNMPGTWRFAEHQYDMIGGGNSSISSTYDGWIDLFGWGTSGFDNKYPTMTTSTNSAYGNGNSNIGGTNYDWGVFNPISNVGSACGQWRTLTIEEWIWIEYFRNNAQNKRATARIQLDDDTYVNGLIFLPDDWSLSVSFVAGLNGYESNTYTIAQWTLMEDAGALFLPAAGYRDETYVSYGNFGSYWSATSGGGTGSDAYAFYFDSHEIITNPYVVRHNGHSVRLVQDVE